MIAQLCFTVLTNYMRIYCKHCITDIRYCIICLNSIEKVLTQIQHTLHRRGEEVKWSRAVIYSQRAKHTRRDAATEKQITNAPYVSNVWALIYKVIPENQNGPLLKPRNCRCVAAGLQQAVQALLSALLVVTPGRGAVFVVVVPQDGDHVVVAELHRFFHRCVPPSVQRKHYYTFKKKEKTSNISYVSQKYHRLHDSICISLSDLNIWSILTKPWTKSTTGGY